MTVCEETEALKSQDHTKLLTAKLVRGLRSSNRVSRALIILQSSSESWFEQQSDTTKF